MHGQCLLHTLHAAARPGLGQLGRMVGRSLDINVISAACPTCISGGLQMRHASVKLSSELAEACNAFAAYHRYTIFRGKSYENVCLEVYTGMCSLAGPGSISAPGKQNYPNQSFKRVSHEPNTSSAVAPRCVLLTLMWASHLLANMCRVIKHG